MKFQAAIFDMDGLLIDSELYWGKAEEAMWPKFGLSRSPSLSQEILGLNLTDTCIVVQKYRPDLSAEFIKSVLNAAAEGVYRQAELLPGAHKLLTDLKHTGTKIGLASSSPQAWIDLFLDKYGLQHFFDEVLSTEGLHLPGKPAPDVYRECMKRLGVVSTATVIFEDTTVGLASARASGAYTIAVPDQRWSFGDFSSADQIASSLADEKVYQVLGLNQSKSML